VSILNGLSGPEKVRLVTAGIWAGALCFVCLVGGIVTLAMFDKDVTTVLSALGSVTLVMFGALGSLLYARMGQVKDSTNGQMTNLMNTVHTMAQTAMAQNQLQQQRKEDRDGTR
jgi:hypothetical protein